MAMSLQRFREELRRVAEAITHASTLHAITSAPYARTLGPGQAQRLQQRLLESARKHLDAARSSILQTLEPAGLPGLPAGRSNAAGREELALADAWKHLAELAMLRGEKDISIAAYSSAADLTPDDATAHAQLADCLESRHRLEEAKIHAEAALRLDPANITASLALARVFLRQERFAEAERLALVAAKASPGSADGRALAWTLVGEARDRLDKPAPAFAAFTQANELMLRHYGEVQHQTHPAHPASVRALTQIVERRNKAKAAPASFATPAPAFLIGFPRSGTTLIEHVLSSHSNITCLEETDHLFEAMSVLLKEGDLFARVDALTSDEIDTTRDAYMDVVLRDRPDARGKIIVDKHPLHITLLPLINKVFPDAKIVHVRRDPRDVVLSCYQQCFGINVATAQFLDIERAAGYFDAVMSLMVTCRKNLALDLYEADYHDVVADLQTEAERIATFLGAEFEPEMLQFNEHARRSEITSASARQVVDPIYARSTGRWRRYRRELASVLPLLNKWARRLGYED